MVKYKACCGRRCLLGTCETRESGGCYCVCQLMDAKHSYQMILDGRGFEEDGAFIFMPNRIQILSEDNKIEYLTRLEYINKKLKTYEVYENE